MTAGGRARGVWPQRVQNSFCTNIVMLHIKSKVMKSRIQWGKTFAPGAYHLVTRGQKVGFWVPFYIVTHLLLWMRTGGTHSEFRCDPWGQGQRRGGPDVSKSILYKHSHVAYQIEGNEE